MKSVVIFFNAIANFKSDLQGLELPDVNNILFINDSIFKQLNVTQKSFFEHIHIINPITYETVLPLVKQYLDNVKKDHLQLVTNDEYCVPIVSQLIDDLNIHGFGEKTSLKFINKIVMKDTLNAHGIRTPYHQLFDKLKYLQEKNAYTLDVEKIFEYPFVIKPVASFGATSFNMLHNRAEWLDHADQISHSNEIFQIEEFVPGTLFHCDAIIQKSHIIFTAISEYIWPIALFKNGYPTGSIYLPTTDARWNKLNKFHQDVINAMQPPDGTTHCELFLSEKNEIVFLEIAIRPSGALVVPIIEKMTGVNLEIAHFKLRLKRSLTIHEKPVTNFSMFCYVPKRHGKVISVELPALKSEVDVKWNIKPGDIIKPISMEENDILVQPHNIAATIILSNPDFNKLYDDFQTLKIAKFINTEDI